MQFLATLGGPKVPNDATVKARVGIGPRTEGGFGLEVALAVCLPGLAKADVEAQMHKAHQVCPNSNATRNSLDVRLDVVEAQ
jgi:organic hydroperoxide reductase OsmC/OhrA